MNCIETKQLSKYYGKSRGIIDLNLQVGEGEVFGFIGPNGAGKSTTIRSLLGLIQPTSGSASVLGMDIREKKNEILKRVGYMPSEAMFYNGMRVQEIIKLSADLHKKDCSKEAKELCDRLQLDVKKRVEELSLGNRKKVSIVCALQHKPDLYIFDEPTSGLDPLMQKEYFNLLEERHDKGATIFLSSHVLSEIQRYCTKAAIIREGKLLVSDTVENLSNTNTKKISIRGNQEFISIFEANTASMGIDKKMMNVITTKDTVDFLYLGEINQLIRLLSNFDLKDMHITEPDLEEIFMHYYKEGGEQ